MENHEKSPLSPVEFRLLVILITNGKLNGRQVAKVYEEKASSLPFGTVYTTLSRLEEQKLITKDTVEGETDDNRMVMFKVTTKGRKVTEEARLFFNSLANFC